MEEESFYFIIKKNQNLKKKYSSFKGCLRVWLRLFFKVFFTRKYIKIIFFIFKKLFLTSAHQNYMKTLKKY
jgi:hypothetical protein